MQNVKNAVFSMILLTISTMVALAIGETILRVKNSSMQNYDIEMWRYAKELKTRSDITLLGHEHVPSAKALLQSVEIRTNEFGLRGGPLPPLQPGKRRILFLGSSVTLGWGVPEEQTVTARLEKMFAADGQQVEVLNAGIGNYNAPRYVERYLNRLTEVKPTDIVVHYFLRDAEVLDAGGGNALLRNSQLAVTTWVATSRYFGKGAEKTLVDHYKAVYQPQAQGWRDMHAALTRLAEHAKQNNIRVYLAMTPDVHDLGNYPFGFVHDQVRAMAGELGYIYVDQLPAMRNLTPKDMWAMPGDPHPNGLGHERMAQAIYPALRLPK
jgi:lysophospholipase L1-like esterase